jgi:hypothetical protein
MVGLQQLAHEETACALAWVLLRLAGILMPELVYAVT